MQVLQTVPYLTNDELRAKLKEQKDVFKFQNWQIILSVQLNKGKSAKEFAQMLGVNVHKIYRIIESYNKNGVDWDKDKKWGGRREARAYLSIDEEKQLLNDIREKALKGEIITVFDIKLLVEKKIGHEVSDDYLWDLLKRHNWKKRIPRPKHPKTDTEAQEEFKKNLEKTWLPPH